MRKEVYLIPVFCLIFAVSGNSFRLNGNGVQYKIRWERKADMPEARRNLKAAAVGNKIYALGGYSQPHKGREKGNFCYDIKSDTWSVKAEMPTGRSNFAIGVAQGKLYAIGGDKFLDKGEAYYPRSDTWMPIILMPTARQHINCGIINDRIFIVGGRISWSKDPYEALVDTHEVYDTKSNSWKTVAPFPGKIENPSISAVKGKMYVINGKDCSLTVFDPASGAWIAKKKIPSAHFIAGSAVIKDKIFVMDGVRPGEDVSRVFVYDPTDDSWGEATSLPHEVKLAGFTSANNKLYVLGGCNLQFIANNHIFLGEIEE